MEDISKYTPNAQKYIRYGWAACDADDDDEEEFDRILEERHQFKVKNFRLEDYDSMIEYARTSPQECHAWRRARERYIAEHQQMEIKDVEKETFKLSNKQLRKAV